jgi:hypothetical protein
LNKKANEIAPKTVNSTIGKIGDKITVSGTVKSIRACGSFAYNGPISKLVVIDTPEGTVKTFTTASWVGAISEGDAITLTGKVKKHEEFKGHHSTLLNYTKVA